MTNSKPPYGDAFWAEAVRLTHEPGNTITQVARDLGVSMEGLRQHVRRAEIEAGRAPGLTADERAELVRLRRENRTLRTEREILKKLTQYLSIRYTERIAEAAAVGSVGSKGDSYDNALAETVNGLFKAELINRHGPWRTTEQVELATANWVHFWNTRRLHGACGDIPPAEFETAYHSRLAAQEAA